eukprot:65502-Rhodomonas_salina.2
MWQHRVHKYSSTASINGSTASINGCACLGGDSVAEEPRLAALGVDVRMPAEEGRVRRRLVPQPTLSVPARQLLVPLHAGTGLLALVWPYAVLGMLVRARVLEKHEKKMDQLTDLVPADEEFGLGVAEEASDIGAAELDACHRELQQHRRRRLPQTQHTTHNTRTHAVNL